MKSQKIKNYENYTISEDGDVMRLLKRGEVKPVTKYKTNSGYTVKLSNTPNVREVYVKTLIEEAFLPEGTYYYADGDVYNDDVSNYTTTPPTYFVYSGDTINGSRAALIGKNRWLTDKGVVYRFKSIEGVYEVVNIKPNSHGYIYTACGNANSTESIHRLVAEIFIPNPDELPVIDHIDENKCNNSVDNLRWCTYAQNSEYYLSDNGKLHRDKLAEQYVEKKKQEVSKVKALKREVVELKQELKEAKKLLDKEREKFMKEVATANKAIERLKHSYHGEANTKGQTFGSVSNMVKATGKSIVVDGVDFDSAGSAATYIVDKELLIGNTRNKNTISKELRRFLQGKRDSWMMYDKYTIGY